MAKDATRWTIRKRGENDWDVLKNSRKSQGGFRSQTDAEGHIRFRMEKGDKVFLEADDGYKEDISRSLRPQSKGWRS